MQIVPMELKGCRKEIFGFKRLVLCTLTISISARPGSALPPPPLLPPPDHASDNHKPIQYLNEYQYAGWYYVCNCTVLHYIHLGQRVT
jgi:hypothetical protein